MAPKDVNTSKIISDDHFAVENEVSEITSQEAKVTIQKQKSLLPDGKGLSPTTHSSPACKYHLFFVAPSQLDLEDAFLFQLSYYCNICLCFDSLIHIPSNCTPI